MMMSAVLRTHGTTSLRAGCKRLEAHWRPGDVGPGLLSLRLEDQTTYDAVEGQVRLDPWIADEYRLIEFDRGECFVLCGAQAVVAINEVTLTSVSEVALLDEETKTIDCPWHVEVAERRLLLLATEQRIWCVDACGAIRWIWSSAHADQHATIADRPVVLGERVRLPLRTFHRDLSVELLIADGLPVGA